MPNHYEKHGMTKTREYRIWIGMLRRCYKPNTQHYDRYGGRGIGVCPAWRESFAAFYADMGESPVDSTLERKNNDLDYSKDNCRWATRWEQSVNRENNVTMTIRGVTKTIAEWVVESGLDYNLVYYRKQLAGWPDEACLVPSGWVPPTKLCWEGQEWTIQQIADKLGISYPSVRLRIKKGWPIEEIINRPNSQPYMKKFATSRQSSTAPRPSAR